MKARIISSIIILLSVYISGNAQQTTITTTSKEVSRNLDLNAVAYIFGESHNLEHFEKQLNNPDNAISNLDLNRDGYVDYLRVVETNMKNIHTVNIQALLGHNTYKDVATIAIQRDHYGKTYVRMIGNEHLYGRNYIINPSYRIQPVIVANFWRPNYRPYKVKYHTHYPDYYKARVVCSTPAYHKHVNYYVTGYYITNRPNAKVHYSYKNNKQHTYKTQHKTNKDAYNYSEKQEHYKQTKPNKQEHKQSNSYSTNHSRQQNNASVRYTNSRSSSTRSNTSSTRTASTNKSTSTRSSQRTQSTRTSLAMK